MLKIGTFNSIEKDFKEFLDKGDFSQCFIIAGWDGIGKRALVDKVEASYGKGDFVTVANFRIEDPDKTQEVSYEIWKYATSLHTSPLVIIIDIQMEAELRLLLKAGLTVHLMRFDVNEWLEWAKSINPETHLPNLEPMVIRMIASSPEMAHSNIKLLSNLQSVSEGLNGEIRKAMEMNEGVEKAINKKMSFQHSLLISKEDVRKDWGNIKDIFEEKGVSNKYSELLLTVDDFIEAFFY